MRIKLILLFILAFSLRGYTQTKFVQIDSLPFSLNTLWKYNITDDTSFASYYYNDSKWLNANNELPLDSIDDLNFNGFCWLRLKLRLNQNLLNKILAIQIEQSGASEIYIDGKKITGFGMVSYNGVGEKRFSPDGVLYPIIFSDSIYHIIAIRYSNHVYKRFAKLDWHYAGIQINLVEYKNQIFKQIISRSVLGFVMAVVGGILLALALLHLCFYLFYREQKHHIYYSTFTFFFSLFFFALYFNLIPFYPDIFVPLFYFTPLIIPFYFIFMVGFLYSLILDKIPKIFFVFIGLGIGIILGFFFKFGHNELLFLALVLLGVIESCRVLYIGLKRKKDGIKIIAGGFALYFLILIYVLIKSFISVIASKEINIETGPAMEIIVVISLLSIPLSISLYLARNFATLNRSLTKKLEEIKVLSAQMLEKEKEKKKILEEQNQVLEEQVAKRTAELSEKNKDIMDSIRYAKRIQNSLLPTEKYIDRILKEKIKD